MPIRPASTARAERRRPLFRTAPARATRNGLAGVGWLLAAALLASLLLFAPEARADLGGSSASATTALPGLGESAGDSCTTATTDAVSELDPAAGPCWPWGRSEPPPSSATDRSEGSRLAVPICLVEGASGIAPLLVHALDGARIHSVPRCGDRSQTQQVGLSTDRGERPEAASDSDVVAALMAIHEPHRRTTEPLLLAPLPPNAVALPPGFVLRVYRPPRAQRS
jgi:hypothetical protein